LRRLGVDRSPQLSPKPSMVAERRRAAWAKFLWRAFPFWAFYVLALRRCNDRARKRDAHQLEETGESVARSSLRQKRALRRSGV
jgi:hypothetical protein